MGFLGFTDFSGFYEGVHEKPIQRGIALKKGAWTVCRLKEGLGKKKRGSIFEWGLIPQCTLCITTHHA